MLFRRYVVKPRALRNLAGFQVNKSFSQNPGLSFSTSSVSLRSPSKYKSKRNKLDVNRRIQTPEELLMQASNVDVENLKKDVEHRNNIRYVKPNQYWINTTFPGLEIPESYDFSDSPSNRKFAKYLLEKNFGKINSKFVWKDLQYTEVDVGDVVDLSGNFEKGDLAVIIELPQQPDDPRYTLVNSYGEIQFVSRSKMGVRIPAVFPKGWFKNCVLEESRFWNDLDENEEIYPIGKPKYSLEDVVERNKIFESVVARSVNDEVETKTYILPSLLSGLISEILSEMTNKAWQFLPDANLKLEVLHNILQSNESPIQLTLYQLFNAVESTNLKELVKGFESQKPEDINAGYKKLLKSISSKFAIGNQFDSISLGKSLRGEADIEMKIDNNKFYAFILSLRKNNQLYTHDSYTKASSYVLVLPLDRIVRFNKMVQEFKSNTQLYEQLALYLINKIENKSKANRPTPTYYYDFVSLLKLYCAGSIQNSTLESFVVKIMRMLPNYKDLDITSSCVYDLLLISREISNIEGPAKWWDNAMIPYSGVSVKCDYEQSFYDSITKDNLGNFVDLKFDLHNGERKLMDDVIYCIDSENPLEIDDGISIKKTAEDELLISTFVADPSSYLDPNSMISRIAFDRGLTLYLPDLAGINSIPLLPIEFGKEIQLGYSNKNTRVLKISFKYNLKKKQVIELEDSEVISFGIANKFVKIDYKSVNKILREDENADSILNEVSRKSNVDVNELKNDLKNLSLVSRFLNEEASKNGRVSLFDEINVKKEIENISENENNQIQLKFKDTYNDDTINKALTNGARSEELVSEIMVMSNHLAGKFCEKNNIPAIYKIQTPLEMSPDVKKFSEQITVKENSSFKELTIYQEYLTKSTISSIPGKHEFLNIDYYSTVTSPLRRFWDLINHWQLHSFVCTGKPLFSQNEVNYQTLQLKYKDELNNKISNKIYGFYTFKALKYLQQQHQTKKGKFKFKVIVTKKPNESGLIEVMMLDYGVRCILETSWYALSENKKNAESSRAASKNLEIGDIIEDAMIKDIDLIDGSIVMTSTTL